MIREFEKLKFREAKEAAKLITLSPRLRKEEIKKVVTSFLQGTIAERKRLGLKTDALEKALANPDRVVDKIMKLNEIKTAKADQKYNIALGSLWAVAGPGLLAGNIAKGGPIHIVEKAGGFVASGLAGWNFANYKYDRKAIRDRIEELRHKRERLADRLIEHH